MATATTLTLDQVLLCEERRALRRFNKEVVKHSSWGNISRARVQALEAMENDIHHLATAFFHLWPHWFLNGRLEKALGTEEQCREVCMEVLSKLEGSQSTCHLDYIKELYIFSGYPIVPTGRRSLALPCDKEGYAENS